jgi:hypothetical protein
MAPGWEGGRERQTSFLLCEPGLPDGIFSNKKSKFGYILERFEIENVRMFNGHLKYITTIWYILWPFW